jgi:hypothetical protein
MPITHQEAQQLFQFSMDNMLSANDKATLFSHLQACRECQAYVRQMKQVESALLPVMKRQWGRQPVPLSIHSLTKKRNTQASIFLVMRTAFIGVAVMAFIFGAWQLTFSAGQVPDQAFVAVLPAATPSIQATTTKSRQACDNMIYVVKANDTLDTIADRFAISKEQLMSVNQLNAEELRPSTKLIVPLCGITPTGTVTNLLTRTYTPITSPALSTPGG